MSYDIDPNHPGSLRSFPPADPRDLEALVALLEVAAIFLTERPESSFTAEQLIAEARKIAGEEFGFDAADMKIVLDGMTTVIRTGDGKFRLR